MAKLNYSFVNGEDHKGKKGKDPEKKKPMVPEVVPETIQPVKVSMSADTVKNYLEKWKDRINGLFNKAEAFEVKSQDDLSTSTEMIGQLKRLDKSIGDAAEAIYKPAYDFYRDSLNLRNSIVVPIKNAISMLNKKNSQYGYELEIERRAAQKLAREAEEKARKDLEKKAKKAGVTAPAMNFKSVVPKAPETVKTQSGSVNIKMVWKAEIIDLDSPEIFKRVLSLMPEKYEKLADQAMNKVIKAGIHEGIKGVRFYEEADARHRSR